ncbi:MAG TPA: antibiotic biosynthesis monooxygenase [Kiloniellales bacterium]
MYASIRKYKIKTESVATLAVRVEDGFVPIISRLPGFVSYMVIDAGDGVVASVSVFESEEAAEQSNAAAAQWVKESLSDVISEAAEITAGEIALAAPAPPAW